VIPDLDLARVRKWIDRRNADMAPEVRGQIRYTKVRRQWSLYWRDSNLKFHEYDPVQPTPHLDELIEYVKNDRSGIFWG